MKFTRATVLALIKEKRDAFSAEIDEIRREQVSKKDDLVGYHRAHACRCAIGVLYELRDAIEAMGD